MIAILQQLTDQLLSTPSLSLEITKQIRISDIRLVGGIIIAVIEYLLQMIDKFLIASHQFGQSLDIVRNIKRIIPCVAFMESGTRLEVLALFRIERRVESAVRQDRTQRSELLAIIMFVT